VQEFKLETAFDASVGHTSGTVVNLSLKTGANQPHGSAYYFHRDPDWNANGFFANRTGQPRGPFTYKRWGGSFLGPVYMPKIYDGRNRTFVSYGYEGLHSAEPAPDIISVPDPRNLTGDFSNLLALGSRYQIYDPATIRPADGGRFSIQPFDGNIIPASRISQIGTNIAHHFPKPNIEGRPDGTNNYAIQNVAEPTLYANHLGRLDHVISDKQRLYVRMGGHDRTEGFYRRWWEDVAVGESFVSSTRQAALDDVYVFSPTLVMNVRYGYLRFTSGHVPRAVGFDPSELGFSPEVVRLLNPIAKMFPCVRVSGFIRMGCEGYDIGNNDVHTLFASVTKQHGTHNIKFGADLRAYRENTYDYGQPGGAFYFQKTFTRGPLDNSPASPGGGQGLAALLLGQPTTGWIDSNDSQSVQSTYWGFYVHDNWRVSRKLTLDIGLRWDYQGPVTERFNRTVRGFDANTAQRIEAQAKQQYTLNPDPSLPLDQFHVRGGLLFAGVGGVPRLLWERSLRDFAPRFGFAYHAIDKVVVRGGFGTFFIPTGQPAKQNAIQPGYSTYTDLVPTLDNGQTFAATLANPFPNGVSQPVGNSLGLETYLGQNIYFYNPAARSPYMMQWDLNTQTLLPGQVLLEVGYVGNKGVKLPANRDANPLPNQYLSTSGFRDPSTIDFLTENLPNPFVGLLPGTALNGATVARQQLLRPFPQFSAVSLRDFQGYSWYHSMQARLERRFSKGFTTLVAYTYSKAMQATEYLNVGDPLPYRSISATDRPHHIAISGIFELPFGRGKPLLGNSSRLADAIVGGWQVGSVWQIHSGEPLGFGNALFLGDIKEIPLPRDQHSIDRWFNTDAGFVTNSDQQLALNLRTFPPLLSGVRADIYNVWDLSLLKKVRLRKRYQVQFPAEFLNAFNHPSSFAPPDTDPTSSSFGRVTNMYSLPRNIQLGLKFEF